MRVSPLSLGLLLSLLALLACGSADESARSEAAIGVVTAQDGEPAAVEPLIDAHAGHDHATAESGVTRVAAGDDTKKKTVRPPGERPLPGFEGRTLAGTRLSMSSLIGKRVMLFFFNPEDEQAEPVARAVAEVAKQARRHNLNIVGVGVGSTSSEVRSFAKRLSLGFPIIDDSDARITTLLRLPGRLMIIGADAEGYVTFILPGFNTTTEDATDIIAAQIRESLRIDDPNAGAGELLAYPDAPLFETQDINGKPFSLADFQGKPKIILFFLHTCPHCHHALEFFEKQLATIPEDKRPVLVAISLQNRPSAIRIALADAGLDYFKPLMDPDQDIATLYGLKGGVPDISMVDAQGQIIYRIQGWRDDRDPPLMRMYLAKIAGEPVPMLLARKGYSGNDSCVACHTMEAATWEVTSHATAYDTLVTHGENRDPECVSCHVVGFDQTGGFSMTQASPHLENVGCENCHGRGGPHISPNFIKPETGYAAACEKCHDTEHSLGFDYETFRPLISHVAIASLTPNERAEQYAGGSHARALLPGNASYVGSDACQSCHTAEHETWSKSPHAHALEVLEKSDQQNDRACLTCHTTAFGKPGGFPEAGDVAQHTDLARVGCESCHGPGGDHVGEGATRLGSILSLGDKCDSCVILQICGSCHDEANDSDFEFQVQDHIDRQRHGTIEAGTGKPLGTSVDARSPAEVGARVAEALRLLEDNG
jgi:peroxiredoxin